MADLERKYLPTMWSKRYTSDVITNKHVEFITKWSENVREQIPCELNIPYGDGSERQKMDIFGTDLDDGSPIYVHIHGGYWQIPSMAHSNQGFVAENLYKNKIKSIFVGYELSPKMSVPDIIKSIEVALVQCLQYAKDHKANGIYLGGHSVGAQMVAHLFTRFIKTLPEDDQQLIKSAFLMCGLYDLTEIPLTSINSPLNLNEASARQISPFFKDMSHGAGTEFFIVAAEHDTYEFVRQAKAFNEKLISDGLKSKYILIEGVDHFDMVENLKDPKYKLTKLLINTMISKTQRLKNIVGDCCCFC